MNYIDIDKLGVSPSSAITEVIAVDANDNIIKADFQPAVTKEEFLQLESVVEKLDSLNLGYAVESINIGTSTNNSRRNSLSYTDMLDRTTEIYIPDVTDYHNGFMTPEMLAKLNNGGVSTIQWGANSNLNDYKEPGVYYITGERLNAGDNMPINNSNPGHTISARLIVLDSSISGTGDAEDKCITQILMLSNRTGGDGNVYTRTAQGSSYNNLVWEKWGKLQTNIEVGVIGSYDNLIDNGIYSGIFSNGTSIFDTFVMVVINNYPVAGQAGVNKSITQILFRLHIDGTFEAVKRTNFYYPNGEMNFHQFTPLNGSLYGYNYPIAPDLTKVGKQTMSYTNTNYTIPSNTLNSLFYSHINELINNNWDLEIFTETVQFQEYNSGGGSSTKLYAEIYCEDENNNLKKYQKIVVGYVVGNAVNQGVKVIQEIDF